MYPEYDPNEPTLGQSFADMLRGLKNPQNLQQVGQGLVNTAKLVPNVVESLGRGGVAQAVGTMGDLRDLRNTVQSYLPQSVQNFSNVAEFMTNPYAKALTQTAPTTEQTLDFVPRVTDPYEGYKQHETLGEYIAPSLGYFGAKAIKAGKNLPIGLSIEDVTPPIEPAKVADALRQPEKNALGFYSPLDEAVMNLQNQKGTGQQYLAQLLKTQGVKQEEVATRGLDTFLTENPKVTREQIAQHLRENPVNLQETVLGADTRRNLNSMSDEDYQLRGGYVIDDTDYIDDLANDEYFNIKNDPDLLEEYRLKAYEDTGIDPADMDLSQSNEIDDYVDNLIRERAEQYANDSYYENPYRSYYDDIGYEVTGSDDVGYYIRDPNGREVPTGRNGIYDIGDAESAIREDAINQGLMHYADDEYGTKYHDYTLPNGENYKEVLIQYEPKREVPKYDIRELPEEDKTFGKYFGVYEGDKLINTWHGSGNAEDWVRGQKENYKDYGNYESGHFDEPNILAHFRTTDRTIDGKKTLFVEEIQSDWHQQGRKKGYFNKQAIEENLAERKRLFKEQEKILEEAKLFTDQNKDAPQNLIDKHTSIDDRLQFLRKEEEKLKKGVPDAPFKKNWQELAMKRAMQMAAEGGYDRVAFTTGKQQADRYSLSKQISKLNYTEDGTLRAFDKNGNQVINKQLSSPDELEDYIGKEAAKKLMEQEPNSIRVEDKGGRPIAYGNPNVFQGRELSGVDLDIGGEGMKGFYDKILPDFINKYGKKHGLKVGQTIANTSKIDLANKIIEENGKYLVDAGDGINYNTFDTKAEAIKSLGGDDPTVHYFDLTPEAKESFLKKGQPMFAVAPVAITDEDTRREVLEKLFNVNNK